MSMETYKIPNVKLELYNLLDEGRSAAKANRKRPYKEVFDDIEREITDGGLQKNHNQTDGK